MPPKKKLSGLEWRTIHVGKGKNRRYMKIAVQKRSGRTVAGKPRKAK